MELPPFPEKRPKGKIKGIKFNKKEREGEIIFNHKELRFCVIKGDEIFGKYNTLVEAYYYKKLLMENNWDKNCLNPNKTISEKIYLNKKIKATKPKVSIRYCPKCGNKIKENENICPICGIELYNIFNVNDYV